MRIVSFTTAATAAALVASAAVLDIAGYPVTDRIGAALEPAAAQASVPPTTASLTFDARFNAANPHGVFRQGKQARQSLTAPKDESRPAGAPSPASTTRSERALEGCDEAYSPLARVQVATFVGRCLT
ncbi:MAG TPA: hypothetical protein VNQ99_17270 [Xanthobacteraceae bacterium]|nr:hypothetical protein [Xanthobacteraceae bacterium]